MNTGNVDKTEIVKMKIPYSNFYKLKQNEDIYSGNEQIPFKERHPIFKCLLRLEFEEAVREYLKFLE
ncbi:MAG: hypothetical protein ACFFB1_15045 [Promethearchaeota archaeon]